MKPLNFFLSSVHEGKAFLQKNLTQALSNEENQSIPLAKLQQRRTTTGDHTIFSTDATALSATWQKNFQAFKAAEVHRDIYHQGKNPRDILTSFQGVNTAVEGVVNQAFSQTKLHALQNAWQDFTQDMAHYEDTLYHMKTTCHQTVMEGIEALTQAIGAYYGHQKEAQHASSGSLAHAQAKTLQGAALKQLQAFFPIQAFAHTEHGEQLYLIHPQGAIHLTPTDHFAVTTQGSQLQVQHNGSVLPQVKGGILPQVMAVYTEELPQALQGVQSFAYILKGELDTFFSQACSKPLTHQRTRMVLPQGAEVLTTQGSLTLGYKQIGTEDWTYRNIDLTGVSDMATLAQALSIPHILQGTWTKDNQGSFGTFTVESTTHQWIYGGDARIMHEGASWSLPQFLRWQDQHGFFQNVRDHATYWQDNTTWQKQNQAPNHSVTTLQQYAFPQNTLKQATVGEKHPFQDYQWSALLHALDQVNQKVCVPWVHGQESQRLAVENTFHTKEDRMKQVHEHYLDQVHEASDTWNEKLLDLLDYQEVLHLHNDIHQRMRLSHRNSLKG